MDGVSLFDEKSPKVLHYTLSAPIWETPNRSPNIKCIVLYWFGSTRWRFMHRQPAGQRNIMIEVFFNEAAQNFDF
jgi:hypothetical protein